MDKFLTFIWGCAAGLIFSMLVAGGNVNRYGGGDVDSTNFQECYPNMTCLAGFECTKHGDENLCIPASLLNGGTDGR